MRKKTYTIKDLAKMLGMSKSTVSRALRNQYDVSPSTREKVLELARKLDFETNTLAASLRGNRSYIIGVIIPSFSIPFYSIALGGIQKMAVANGYNVMVCQTGEDFDNEVNTINYLLKSRVDGILISLSKNTDSVEHLLKVKNRGVPVVMFNRVVEDFNIPRVLIDDYTGALNATRHLIEKHCRNIAHISGPASLLLSKRRMKGFTDALLESNLTFNNELVVESDFTLESGKEAMKKLLSMDQQPDAVFCVCDAVAFGAMSVIKEKGLNVPEDISVAGFTNEPMAALVSPSLTTVAQPIEDIGGKSVEILLEYINNFHSPHNTHHLVLTTELIIRDSTLKNR